MGTSYDSLSRHSKRNPEAEINMNEGRLIHAVGILSQISYRRSVEANDDIGGALKDIILSLPEPLRMPEIQSHMSENFLKNDENTTPLPKRLVD